MKIVLSRKGFDSGAGGVANPLLPDGRLAILPIPGGREPHRFGDVTVVGGYNAGDVVESLTKGKVKAAHRCHLDPDLDEASAKRGAPFQAGFGQIGAAASHLANQGVMVGDLFLFFSWFREVEIENGQMRFKPKAIDRHIIYGWMQIGEMLMGEALQEAVASNPSLAAHPHAVHTRMAKPLNTIILPTEKLSIKGFKKDIPGFGLFPIVKKAQILSSENKTRSWWRLPDFMAPDTMANLSYHENKKIWQKENDGWLVKSAARGQEFVLSDYDIKAGTAWLKDIFTGP